MLLYMATGGAVAKVSTGKGRVHYGQFTDPSWGHTYKYNHSHTNGLINLNRSAWIPPGPRPTHRENMLTPGRKTAWGSNL